MISNIVLIKEILPDPTQPHSFDQWLQFPNEGMGNTRTTGGVGAGGLVTMSDIDGSANFNLGFESNGQGDV